MKNSEIPQLRPLIVTTNTKADGASAFLLSGMSKKGTVYVLEEWYREEEESFSNVEAFERLIEWLEDMKEKYFDVIPPGDRGHRKFLQPRWVFCRSKEFINHYQENHRGDFYLKVAPGNTDLDEGIERILTLIEKDLLNVSEGNCPNLKREMKSMDWEDTGKGLPVLNCLVDGVNGVLNSSARKRVSGKMSSRTEPVTNRQLIKEFFS